jgi:hypothetical protein
MKDGERCEGDEDKAGDQDRGQTPACGKQNGQKNRRSDDEGKHIRIGSGKCAGSLSQIRHEARYLAVWIRRGQALSQQRLLPAFGKVQYT